MSLEITVLRLLKDRKEYERLARAIPAGVLEERTNIILSDYGRWFRENPDAAALDLDAFYTSFKFYHPTLNQDQLAFYKTLIAEQLSGNVSEQIRDGLMGRIIASDYANRYTKLLERYAAGEEVDLGMEMRNLVDAYETETAKNVKVPWVDTPIEDLLLEDQNDVGFKWRIPELNASMRPLRPGDFIIGAARPDVGKTTFFTDNLTFMAGQVDELFPGEMRSILWFNNEGPGVRIKKRCYQSALNATTDDMVTLNKAGQLRQRYVEATGRGDDILKIIDVHDFWNHEIEDIIKKYPPAIIVFDMIDNIKFGGNVNNNGQRTDQLLEAMYQWARVIGVKHNCVVIATSQVSADGENLAYPTLSMLKDSKTGKQGAADAILTIGYIDTAPDQRYLGLTKNKLHKEGGPKSPQIQVHFDGLRGRYVSTELMKRDQHGQGHQP